MVPFFGFRSARFCSLPRVAPLLLEVPKMSPGLSRSPSELPEPTPKKTKPSAKTSARKTKTHLACLRRRGKNICASYSFAGLRDCLRLGALAGRGRWDGRCFAAPRAISVLGYLDLGLIGVPRKGRPVELPPDRLEPLARARVAERALDAGLVERARGDSQGGGYLVVAPEVGVEHRRVVGRDRAERSGGDEARQRVLGERGDRARPQVRQRAHVEHDAAVCDLAQEAGILGRADPVAEPVGAERVER